VLTRRRQTIARIGEKGIREGILPVSALVGSAARRALFVGACGTKDEVVPTSWYAQWGLTRRDSCKITNQYGKRAERVAPGEWLSIGPRRACPRHKEYDSSYRNGFRFCYAARLNSLRAQSLPLVAGQVRASLRANLRAEMRIVIRADLRERFLIVLPAGLRADGLRSDHLRSCTSPIPRAF